MAKNDPGDAAPQPTRSVQQTAREQRLAKALRENLRRRKAPAAASPDASEKDGR